MLLQLFQSLSMSLISNTASHYGDEPVAAMGIVLRIVTIGANVVFGYMKGFQPMAGFNYGAKKLPVLINCHQKLHKMDNWILHYIHNDHFPIRIPALVTIQQ